MAAAVDGATPGVRGMPSLWEGGMYHVLAVLGEMAAATGLPMLDEAAEAFPLDAAAERALRADLAARTHRIARAERDATELLAAVTAT